jgi:hypothetical protein
MRREGEISRIHCGAPVWPIMLCGNWWNGSKWVELFILNSIAISRSVKLRI